MCAFPFHSCHAVISFFRCAFSCFPDSSATPAQDFRDQQDKARSEAHAFQKELRDKRASGSAASAAGASGSAAAAAASGSAGSAAAASGSAAALPKAISFVAARRYLPPSKGALIWYEPKTDRVRGAYIRDGTKVSHSATREPDEREAMVYVLRWIWKEHFDATGELAAYAELR